MGERRAADRHHRQGQTISANDASATVSKPAKQWHQFGAFLALYAEKNGLVAPPTAVAMPAAIIKDDSEMDPELLAPEGFHDVVDEVGNATVDVNAVLE